LFNGLWESTQRTDFSADFSAVFGVELGRIEISLMRECARTRRPLTAWPNARSNEQPEVATEVRGEFGRIEMSLMRDDS